MKIGTLDITNCKIGSTQVNEIRIGSTLVWQFSSLDPDAQAFITAAGITNPTQQTAINTLVVSLKGYGLWTKMKAIYPFVGGTATTHKFNLKNPLDTNAAFRLTFNGGWIHNSSGITPNSTNTYADTFLIANTVLSVHNYSFSAYSRTNVSDGNRTVMGGGTGYTPMMALKIFNPTAFEAPNFGTSAPSYTETTGLGLFTGVRTAINNGKVYRNGVLKVTNTTSATSTNLPTFKTVIGAFNQGGAIESYSNKQLAFASIGDGLSDTEAANFYTAVQTFQTTLGRNV
jgi:hypothetical protein